MEGKEVKLVGFWVSPFVLRVAWALKLKGVEYEYIEEDVFNKSPLLLELNPVHKKVPILVHGGRPIAESFVILEYVDETWEESPLLPQDPRERAMARFWAKFAEEKIFEVLGHSALRSEGSEQERAASLAKEALEKLEEELKQKGKRFFGGDEGIGYVDIAAGWISYMLPVFEEVGSIKILDPQKFPAITEWIGNFLDQPVVKGSLPDRDKMIQYFQGRRKLNLSLPSGRFKLA